MTRAGMDPREPMLDRNEVNQLRRFMQEHGVHHVQLRRTTVMEGEPNGLLVKAAWSSPQGEDGDWYYLFWQDREKELKNGEAIWLAASPDPEGPDPE